MNKRLQLRAIAVGIAAVLALGACTPAAAPGQSQGSTAKTRLQLLLPFSFVGEKAVYFAAQEQGYFAEENLEVELLEGTGGSTIISLMAANPTKTDVVGVADLPAVAIAIGEGSPLKSVMNRFQASPNGLTYRKDRGINSVADLAGKKIGFAPGGTEGIIIPAALEANGVDPSSVEIVNIDGPAKETALEAGQVDAISVYVTSQPIRLAAAGVDVGSWSIAEIGVPLVGEGVIVTQAMIDQKPDVIRALLRALVKGEEFSRANPEKAIEALKKGRPDTKIDDKLQLAGLKAAFPLTESEATKEHGLGYHVPELWTDMLDFMESHDFGLTKRLELDAYFTNDFLPKKS